MAAGEPVVALTPQRRLEGELLVRWARTLEEHKLDFEAWVSKVAHRSPACAAGAGSRKG